MVFTVFILWDSLNGTRIFWSLSDLILTPMKPTLPGWLSRLWFDSFINCYSPFQFFWFFFFTVPYIDFGTSCCHRESCISDWLFSSFAWILVSILIITMTWKMSIFQCLPCARNFCVFLCKYLISSLPSETDTFYKWENWGLWRL